MNNTLCASLAAAALLLTAMRPVHATTYGPPTPTAFPIHPFQASLVLTASGVTVATGTGTDLGVTSITISNQSSASVMVGINQVSTTSPKCTGQVRNFGVAPSIFVMAPAFQTLQLQYPTALVVKYADGGSCLGFTASSGVSSSAPISVLVVGYQN